MDLSIIQHVLAAEGDGLGSATPPAGGAAAPAANSGFSILPKTGELVGKIQSGNIHLSDIPTFIAAFIQSAILLAGMVAFIMLLVGGYQYIIGGVYSDMREQGKNTIMYALGGFILAMMAYGIVTVVQLAATSL